MTAPRRLAFLAAVALASLLPACQDRAGTNPLPPPPGVDLRPRLAPFDTCEDLEAAIEDAMVLEMRSQLEQGRVGFYPPGGVATDGAAPGAPTANAGGPTSYSTTTSQVEGVGEADFVQNDGTRLAVLANGALHLATSWPADALAIQSTTRIEGWAHDLFLAGNRVVVFSSVYQLWPMQGALGVCPVMGAPVAADFWCGYTSQNSVKLTTFDVTDLKAPVVVSEVYLPGAYVSARRLGDRVRLVTSDSLPFPEGVRWWPELRTGATEAERKAAFDALIAANEALIRARTLDDWLRRGTLTRPGLPDVELGYACTDFAHGSAPVRPGLVSVTTFDVAAAAQVSRTTIFGEAGTVYASADTLWVAAPHWWWWPEVGQRDTTYLHAFDLTGPDRAGYLGSGVVDGFARDQYAFDEHAGALRVATTVSERVDDGTPWGRIKTAGRITVLQHAGTGYDVVGETPPFGEGERVFGTRFLGPRGFVITAAVMDPLFTFDLAAPTAPRMVKALEMPGFLSYLHPVDATHLLGIGQQGGGAAGAMQVKVTLLDVTDLAAPVDLATVLVGEGWSWSEAVWDPKAFTWLGARKLMAIPMAGYDGAGNFASDLKLYRVDPAAASPIAFAGRLSMSDVYQSASGPNWYWAWSPYVRRSVLASDEVGPAATDYVYAITDAGVRSANVALLPAWLATVQFDPDVTPLPTPDPGPVPATPK